MTLVRVLDLVGKDIAGLTADVRSRVADGSLNHDWLEKEGPRIVTMEKVIVKQEKVGAHGPKVPWLYWYWEGYSCGYSGSVLDTDSARNAHILIDFAGRSI